ncbi:sensor histidine kinase [Nonomuraea soli]|uniref:histidine kinase n=1 Tax=Nonomuraea soli TaxID=1032476 RepID=A0A7W0CRN2_9ACTN|nr:sensor histidine kinase [Nonomuraea soli]MBA2896091.1 signal transduction histidine kinase [Nonomuraea soli]
MHNRRASLFDSVLAACLAVASLALYLTRPAEMMADVAAAGPVVAFRPPDGVGAALVVLSCAPVAVRRRWPLAALCLGLVPEMLAAGLGYGLSGLAPLVLLYSVAAYRGLAVALLGLLLALAANVSALAAMFTPVMGWADYLVGLVLLGGAWGLGRTLRLRRAYLDELKDRAARLERAREADTRAARAEERSRIARELHDVVAHHVSVMTVQAAAARRVLTEDPEQAREALSAIESTGRVAMREMRHLVEVLRGPAERGPQPGMGLLPQLVEQMREAGLPTSLVVEGEPAALPAGVDLAAYRLVQEGLTNSLRHAGSAAQAVVTVRHRPGELDVEVRDDGRGPEPEGEGRGGHGLVGIRERVALYGGILRAGPRQGGGFEIQARFPL